jgi:hypothetical protein
MNKGSAGYDLFRTRREKYSAKAAPVRVREKAFAREQHVRMIFCRCDPDCPGLGGGGGEVAARTQKDVEIFFKSNFVVWLPT